MSPFCEIQIWCAQIAVLLLTVIHQYNKSKMAFTYVTTLLRIHLAGYIGIIELLALYNRKRERLRKDAPPVQPELFIPE